MGPALVASTAVSGSEVWIFVPSGNAADPQAFSGWLRPLVAMRACTGGSSGPPGGFLPTPNPPATVVESPDSWSLSFVIYKMGTSGSSLLDRPEASVRAHTRCPMNATSRLLPFSTVYKAQ